MIYVAYFILCALFFFTGASVFSFLNVVAWRIPRGESPLKGRSYCPACGRSLNPLELVPVLSFLVLRGRCRTCGSTIPVRDFWVEVLGGVLAIGCYFAFPRLPQAVLMFAVLSVLMVVTLIDWDTQIIPNRFSVLLLVCALASVAAVPEISIVSRLIGCLVVSVPMLVIAIVIPGGFGGGDIKLMFAVGALLGWKLTLCAMFFGTLTGGIYAVGLLVRKKAGRRDRFAFGPFLCAGTAIAIFFGEAIVAWYSSLF